MGSCAAGEGGGCRRERVVACSRAVESRGGDPVGCLGAGGSRGRGSVEQGAEGGQ